MPTTIIGAIPNVRRERVVVVTPKGHAVLALIRRQDALSADDGAGRGAIGCQIGKLLAAVDLDPS